MHLGTLLNHLEVEANAGAALLALGDITLFARVEAMGAEHDEEPGEYVANGARRFAARASDEDWLGLMNAIERADDPGRAVLEKIVIWSLDKDTATGKSSHEGCSCGGGGGCHGPAP
jgi:hypothetical protein